MDVVNPNEFYVTADLNVCTYDEKNSIYTYKLPQPLSFNTNDGWHVSSTNFYCPNRIKVSGQQVGVILYNFKDPKSILRKYIALFENESYYTLGEFVEGLNRRFDTESCRTFLGQLAGSASPFVFQYSEKTNRVGLAVSKTVILTDKRGGGYGYLLSDPLSDKLGYTRSDGHESFAYNSVGADVANVFMGQEYVLCVCNLVEPRLYRDQFIPLLSMNRLGDSSTLRNKYNMWLPIVKPYVTDIEFRLLDENLVPLRFVSKNPGCIPVTLTFKRKLLFL